MKLTTKGLSDRAEWEKKGYALMEFDREAVEKRTHDKPEWVHFGAGNIFRAFIAADAQRMLDKGYMETGIIVAEGYDYEIIDKAYRPFDNLALNVTLKADGSIDKTVLGSVVESLVMDSGTEDWARLKEIFRSPSLRMASFTITEKGYSYKDQNGEVFPYIAADIEAGPERAASYTGKVAALAYERFLAGALPLAYVSMDNCSHNGSKLQEVVSFFAGEWEKRGLVNRGFAEYIADRSKNGFPWSMIDKITPRPDAKVIAVLKEDGFEDTESFKTSKGTFVAPFVNAEQTQYLVIEDWFPNGHPELDRVGVIFTERATVDKVEKMKVCTCLNPLHTALAVYGCLLGYELISEEMKDADLKRMVELIGYKEGLPVVVDPGILDPKEFIDTVINMRLPNVFMPDTPQRIATDTSQKLPIRYGETIKAYLASDALSVEDLRIIPLVFAGWCRYLMGVDDNGDAFAPSEDPLLDELSGFVKDIKPGDKGASAKLRPILSNAAIFGVDLYEAGLGKTVEGYFDELVAGIGAVRATLHKYVNA